MGATLKHPETVSTQKNTALRFCAASCRTATLTQEVTLPKPNPVRKPKRQMLGEPVQVRLPAPVERTIRDRADKAGLSLGTWLRLQLTQIAKDA